MTCPFYHKLCKKVGCDNHVCRAYFPERQPNIMDDMLDVCLGDNYEAECPRYSEGLTWREKRKREQLKLHCPYAHNSVCGRPWVWLCKTHQAAFFLTEAVKDKRGMPQMDEEGEVVFMEGKSLDDISDTCLSGRTDVYAECPYYIAEQKYREMLKDK